MNEADDWEARLKLRDDQCRAVFGRPFDELKGDERQQAKQLTHYIMYSFGLSSIKRLLNGKR